MSQPKPTGYVRTIPRVNGPVYYAHIRTADGRRLQPKLGPAWTKRSRPAAGYLTPGQAESRLADILAGKDPDIIVVPASGVVFTHAANEWLRWVAEDRKREVSTVQGYRRAIEGRLIPRFGSTALEVITTDDADAWRLELLAEGLSANTINKLRWKGEAIYKRAQRVWGIAHNPFALVDRQPQQPPDDFNVLEPVEVLQLASQADDQQDAAFYIVATFTGLRLSELPRCAGQTSTSPTASCTSAAASPPASSRPTQRADAGGRCR
jgi:Phage integrase, N-terminal SAM-like domain